MASLTQTRNPLIAYRCRCECECDWKSFQRVIKSQGLPAPKLLKFGSTLRHKGLAMFNGQDTFRSRIPYERLIAFANEAEDCHVLMETLALIDDFDGVRRDVGVFSSCPQGFAVSGHIDYPHEAWKRDINLSNQTEASGLTLPSTEDLRTIDEWEALLLEQHPEPTDPAPSVPEVPEVSCDLTLCSDDDLWAELARRGLMVNGGEAILVNTC